MNKSNSPINAANLNIPNLHLSSNHIYITFFSLRYLAVIHPLNNYKKNNSYLTNFFEKCGHNFKAIILFYLCLFNLKVI